jgi:hypothetical protein
MVGFQATKSFLVKVPNLFKISLQLLLSITWYQALQLLVMFRSRGDGVAVRTDGTGGTPSSG